MHQVHFYKYQANGNDFIIIEGHHPTPEWIVRSCDRHKGIGADGVLVIESKQEESTAKMTIYNNDGTTAQMCGNGVLCAIKFLSNKGFFKSNSPVYVKLPTRFIQGRITSEGLGEFNIGKADFEPQKVPFLTQQTTSFLNKPIDYQNSKLQISVVNMGNPHCVVFLDQNPHLSELDDLKLTDFEQLQKSKYFPESTNIQFVKIISASKVKCRVLERGVGETLACGSGACAVAAAGKKLGKLESEVAVEYRGGTIGVRVEGDGNIFMSGKANFVFQGTIAM